MSYNMLVTHSIISETAGCWCERNNGICAEFVRVLLGAAILTPLCKHRTVLLAIVSPIDGCHLLDSCLPLLDGTLRAASSSCCVADMH
jgi:hypothetical protein